MTSSIRTDHRSQDLFEDPPVTPRTGSVIANRPPAELRSARVLSRALARQRTRREKRRIAHLICLNLISMLRNKPGG